MKNNVLKFLDEIDACVFSSDFLLQEQNRIAFQEYLDRWNRAIKENPDIQEDN